MTRLHLINVMGSSNLRGFSLSLNWACIKEHVSKVSLSRICRWLSLNLIEETCWVVKYSWGDRLIIWMLLISLFILFLRLRNKLKTSFSIFIHVMRLMIEVSSSLYLFHFILELINLHIHCLYLHLIIILETINFISKIFNLFILCLLADYEKIGMRKSFIS